MNTDKSIDSNKTSRTVTQNVAEAFRQAKAAQEEALDGLIDTLALAKAAHQLAEQTLTPMRAQLKADLDPGATSRERVRRTTASGSVALVYRRDKSNFSKAKLERMIADAREKGDNRRAKTLCDVLTECFTTEPLAALTLDINP